MMVISVLSFLTLTTGFLLCNMCRDDMRFGELCDSFKSINFFTMLFFMSWLFYENFSGPCQAIWHSHHVNQFELTGPELCLEGPQFVCPDDVLVFQEYGDGEIDGREMLYTTPDGKIEVAANEDFVIRDFSADVIQFDGGPNIDVRVMDNNTVDISHLITPYSSELKDGALYYDDEGYIRIKIITNEKTNNKRSFR